MSSKHQLPERQCRTEKKPRYTTPEYNLKEEEHKEDETEWEIEKIIGWRREENLYLVKWLNYPHSCDCWMHSDNLQNAMGVIAEYHAEAAYPSHNFIRQMLRSFDIFFRNNHSTSVANPQLAEVA